MVKNKNAEPNVVCIGGGTGHSTMLRGLKQFTSKITAIVAMSDDGGGSGMLREELGMVPPGDVRNCLLALANIEPVMEKLFSYRFDKGTLKGQSFGNLFLAAMNGVCGSFDEAVARMSDVLAITGRVLPVTTENINLFAEFENGQTVLGESKIFAAKKLSGCKIQKVRLIPERPKALPDCIEALKKADIIVIGPGSLYTSLIPNLLVDGIAEAVKASGAVKIYVANIMTQDGETEGYTLADHIREIFHHSGGQVFDICLVNNKKLSEELLCSYRQENAEQIFATGERLEDFDIKVYERDLAGFFNGYIRHNPSRLAEEIEAIYKNERPLD